MWKRKCLLALIEYKHTESKQKCAYSLFKTWKELEERVAVADSDKRIAEKRREDIASIGVFASKALEGVGKLSTSAKKALAHIRKHISSYIRRKRNQPSPDSIQHVGELEELLSESHSIGGRELRQRATLIQLKVRHESEGDMSTALLTARADDSTFIANISSGLGPLAAPQFPSALHLDVEREMKQRESIGKLREEVDNLDGALRTAEKQSEEVEVARKGKLAQPVQNSKVEAIITDMTARLLPAAEERVARMRDAANSEDEAVIAMLAKLEDACEETNSTCNVIAAIDIDRAGEGEGEGEASDDA
mmetsp:Transcript_34118/g.88047  ORF Transcript_34118/g.88047 Transcript_34118/m.88047 type:complete len:307 (-) Transcript_34118:1816-2736(-)